MRHRIPLPALALAAFAACSRGPVEVHAPGLRARGAVAEAEPIGEDRAVAGQTLYVPAYSSVYTSDRAHRINLAVTLSVRNADPAHPIVLTAVRYHDQDGRLVRDDVPRPLRLGPLAAVEFFIPEGDTRGGLSASFLVAWVADRPVADPVVEAIMVSTAGNQGISFLCPARVLADRARPAPGFPGPRRTP